MLPLRQDVLDILAPPIDLVLLKFAQIALGCDAPRVVLVDAFEDVEGTSLGVGGRVNLIWVLALVFVLGIITLPLFLFLVILGLIVLDLVIVLCCFWLNDCNC